MGKVARQAGISIRRRPKITRGADPWRSTRKSNLFQGVQKQDNAANLLRGAATDDVVGRLETRNRNGFWIIRLLVSVVDKRTALAHWTAQHTVARWFHTLLGERIREERDVNMSECGGG